MILTSAEQRHKFLIESSTSLLEEGRRLLEQMSDRQYVSSPAEFPDQRIGSHIRHIVEFYECFLDGRRLAHIDYDARKREATLESDRRATMVRINSLIGRLTGFEAPTKDSVLFVRIEDAEAAGMGQGFVVSSVGRELQSLNSHTVHHFGLIAMLARLLGIPVQAGFGFAPSTLRYKASQRSEAA